LLVGDGQQAIYPGGFRLAEAGISVANRSISLKTNYRNTVEILAAARGVLAGDQYDDLDVEPHQAERDVEVVRHGDLPVHCNAASTHEHDAALLWDLCQLLERPETRPSDIAVLAATNSLAEEYGRLLEANGVAVSLLKDGWGDGVHVGTWARSKGTEFSYVFLPQVDRRTMLTTGGGAAARAEKEELLRRQLFVAMTRARDGLWVGRVSA
jgi:superfamily I DNA/RNA helicase